MISDMLSGGCRFAFLVALATAALAGCLEAGALPSGEEPSAELPRQEYRVQLPDGRIATVTGIRRGDMLLVGDDMMIPLHGGDGRDLRTAIVPIMSLWPTTVIPYEFSASVDAATRQRVLSAMDPWKAAGFIFLPRTTQASYVFIREGAVAAEQWRCKATIGFFQGAFNNYWAGTNCRTRDYVHEWGHILGLYHEHERSDRDQYINVLDPIIGGTIVEAGGADWGPYDFGSIMHYDPYGRNADGSIDRNHHTFEPRDNRSLDSFGQNEVPSGADLNTLWFLYQSRLPGVPLYQMYSYQSQD